MMNFKSNAIEWKEILGIGGKIFGYSGHVSIVDSFYDSLEASVEEKRVYSGWTREYVEAHGEDFDKTAWYGELGTSNKMAEYMSNSWERWRKVGPFASAQEAKNAIDAEFSKIANPAVLKKGIS